MVAAKLGHGVLAARAPLTVMEALATALMPCWSPCCRFRGLDPIIGVCAVAYPWPLVFRSSIAVEIPCVFARQLGL